MSVRPFSSRYAGELNGSFCALLCSTSFVNSAALSIAWYVCLVFAAAWTCDSSLDLAWFCSAVKGLPFSLLAHPAMATHSAIQTTFALIFFMIVTLHEFRAYKSDSVGNAMACAIVPVPSSSVPEVGAHAFHAASAL